jgi:hypothetical protein
MRRRLATAIPGRRGTGGANRVLRACQGSVERRRNKNLVMNDAELSGYVKHLGEVRKQLEDDLVALAEISDALNNIAKGVEAGSKIVRLLG